MLTSDSDEVEPVKETPPPEPTISSSLHNIKNTPHEYHLVTEAKGRAKLIQTLRGLKSFCF